MPTDEANDRVDEVIERCQRDSSLNLLDELRKVTTRPEGIALLDAIESRREGMRKRLADAFMKHVQIQATPETGEAIRSYHQDLVMPLLLTLIDELSGIECELALHKSQLESGPLRLG